MRSMAGKPFQSKLSPFFEEIKKRRRAAHTWAQIAEYITAQGTATTASSVYEFFVRRRKRPYPVGMEPEEKIQAVLKPDEQLSAPSKAKNNSHNAPEIELEIPTKKKDPLDNW
jgi:hypothetical protein